MGNTAGASQGFLLGYHKPPSETPFALCGAKLQKSEGTMQVQDATSNRIWHISEAPHDSKGLPYHELSMRVRKTRAKVVRRLQVLPHL